MRQDEENDIWIPEGRIPTGKKLRLDKSSEEEVELGTWLEMAEGRCMRAGKLKSLLKKDQERMIRRMETLEEDQLLESLGTWWSKVLIIPEEQLLGGGAADLKGLAEGARHPMKKPNTTCCSTMCNPVSSQPDGNLKKHKPGTSGVGARHPKKQPNSTCTHKGYWNMIGLIGWWRRVENEKSKETKKTGTPDGWKLETDARINFVKQFFPDLSESPGGTTKLNKSDSCIKKKN